MKQIKTMAAAARAMLDTISPAKTVEDRLGRIEIMCLALVVERLVHNGDLMTVISNASAMLIALP